jgi:hypothetical protein
VLILQETIELMTDCFHLAGFKEQVKIIMQLVLLVEKNLVKAMILNQGVPHGYPSNKDFVMAYLADGLLGSFPNMNKLQVEAYII